MRDDGDVRGAMGRLRRMYHGEPVQSVYAGTITAAYDRVRHDEETVARFAVAVIDDVTDDVRAAAERLAEWSAAERVRAHRAVMARHPEATDEGCPLAAADASAVADAYLAEHTPRPLEEWHEDCGDVLWWLFPVREPPYCGTPLCTNWPGYHTHWTPTPMPCVTKEMLNK